MEEKPGSPEEKAAETIPVRPRVRRNSILLEPQHNRVVIQPFDHGDEAKCRRIVDRVLAMPDNVVEAQLSEVLREFAGRHTDLEGLLSDRFRQVRCFMPTDEEPSHSQRVLIGAYFMSEYALESAALFNPSIVPHPDQSGVAKHSVRVVISLRATGEGHISSIEFRCGIVDGEANLSIDPGPSLVTTAPITEDPDYRKTVFRTKLTELGLNDPFTAAVMQSLGARFTHAELEDSIAREMARNHARSPEVEETAHHIRSLAELNYRSSFTGTLPLSQRVIFPRSSTERQGIEDARFVRFEDEATGKATYFATYTAYDGQLIFPQLLETEDFVEFQMSTLGGAAAHNKGMALFPRKINGRYAMLSRLDNENLFLMYSKDVHLWPDAKPLMGPKYPWEFVKIGNCGSPMETEAGWLVLTHGVGPMRKYCIGAMLLDLEDPSQVIGRLREPLIEPLANEREGYVPNVVYSCGAMIHAGEVIIPYAMSDYASTVANVKLDELLAALTSAGPGAGLSD